MWPFRDEGLGVSVRRFGGFGVSGSGFQVSGMMWPCGGDKAHSTSSF